MKGLKITTITAALVITTSAVFLNGHISITKAPESDSKTKNIKDKSFRDLASTENVSGEKSKIITIFKEQRDGYILEVKELIKNINSSKNSSADLDHLKVQYKYIQEELSLKRKNILAPLKKHIMTSTNSDNLEKELQVFKASNKDEFSTISSNLYYTLEDKKAEILTSILTNQEKKSKELENKSRGLVQKTIEQEERINELEGKICQNQISNEKDREKLEKILKVQEKLSLVKENAEELVEIDADEEEESTGENAEKKKNADRKGERLYVKDIFNLSRLFSSMMLNFQHTRQRQVIMTETTQSVAPLNMIMSQPALFGSLDAISFMNSNYISQIPSTNHGINIINNYPANNSQQKFIMPTFTRSSAEANSKGDIKLQ